MFQLIAMHALIFMTIVTSVMGAICLWRGSKIFDLSISTRNFMHIGACCAMVFGIFAATYCVGQLVTTVWDYVAAIVLCAISLFATSHIVVDLGDRLSVDKQHETCDTPGTILVTAPKAKIYDFSLYRSNFGKTS